MLSCPQMKASWWGLGRVLEISWWTPFFHHAQSPGRLLLLNYIVLLVIFLLRTCINNLILIRLQLLLLLLCISLSVCLSIYLSVCLSVCLSLSTQPVQADGRPPRARFCPRFLPVKGGFSSPPSPSACSGGFCWVSVNT